MLLKFSAAKILPNPKLKNKRIDTMGSAGDSVWGVSTVAKKAILLGSVLS